MEQLVHLLAPALLGSLYKGKMYILIMESLVVLTWIKVEN